MVFDNGLYDELLTPLAASWRGLPDKPDEDAESTLRTLWFVAAGVPLPVQTAAQAGAQAGLPGLDEDGAARLRALVAARSAGQPLAYLRGRQEFMGLELLASPDAMIPRKETVILGRAALGLLETLAGARGAVRVLDLCTGSGNLALALAHYVLQCAVVGADISDGAIRLAQSNAVHTALSQRVSFIVSDLFAAFESAEYWQSFDLVVCNPPYISAPHVSRMPQEIAQFEPAAAFDGGPLGLSVITRLIREAPRFLRPDSWLCFEVGLGQGELVAQRLARVAAYSQINRYCDEQGETRVLSARTPPV